MKEIKNVKKGFTLLELLVVVLIIGILAAIALPQYKKAVEKARMAEAVTNVKAIAQAQQRYYLLNGNYTTCMDFNSLDIEISGENSLYGSVCPAKQTSNFLYTSSALSTEANIIAIAQRLPALSRYYIFIKKDNPNRVRCKMYNDVSDIQEELCQKLNATGTL